MELSKKKNVELQKGKVTNRGNGRGKIKDGIKNMINTRGKEKTTISRNEHEAEETL